MVHVIWNCTCTPLRRHLLYIADQRSASAVYSIQCTRVLYVFASTVLYLPVDSAVRICPTTVLTIGGFVVIVFVC